MIESGSQYVVDKIVNKHLDLNYVQNKLLHLRLDMSVHGGLPGETKEHMIETKKFINDTNFNTVQDLVQQN